MGSKIAAANPTKPPRDSKLAESTRPRASTSSADAHAGLPTPTPTPEPAAVAAAAGAAAAAAAGATPPETQSRVEQEQEQEREREREQNQDQDQQQEQEQDQNQEQEADQTEPSKADYIAEEHIRTLFAGAPHFFFYRSPKNPFEERRLRLAQNVLLLEHGRLLVRLEGAFDRARAIELARSLEAG